MRIGAAATSYVVGVTVIATVASTTLAWREWEHLATIENTEKLIRVIGAASRFVEAMALERGVYNQVIVSAESSPEVKRRLVRERNAFTDKVFDDTFAALSQVAGSRTHKLEAPFKEARHLVVEARARGNRAMETAGRERTAVAAALLADFVNAAHVIDGAMIGLQRDVSETDARIGQMVTISRLSNEMREAAGQRSTILSRYAGSRERLDTGSVLKIAELTGTLHSTWERLKRIASQIENSPALERAIEATERTFMIEGEPLYQDMATAAREGTGPPMAFLAWRAWTVAMLGNTLTARDAPIEQALADIEKRSRAALTRLWLVLAGGVSAVLLFVGGGYFIERRVVRPVIDITLALDDAAPRTGEDGSHALVRYVEREDEVGALSRALKTFKQESLELQALHDRFDTALANLPQGLAVFDAAQRLIVCNTRYLEIHDLSADQVKPGASLTEVFEARRNAHSLPYDDASFIAALKEMQDSRSPSRVEKELQNGRTVAVSIQALPDGGWVSTHEDVTARRRAEAQIAHMAHHDALTGLPNRVLFRDRMKQALTQVGRGADAAVLCLDLDHFKSINDTLGHPAGDALLRTVAARLFRCVRETDTVARMGGDEFAILQVGADQPNGAAELSRRVIEILNQPCEIDGEEICTGISIGVALAPADAMDPDQLLKSADLALYRAKAEGRGRYRFFEAEMDARVQARRTLETDMRKALAAGEFELYFQPIIDLRHDKVGGFEALLRWNHPERGMLPPAEFISVAEENGLIVPIGEWALHKACTHAVRWPGQLNIAVNLSPAQFRRRSLVASVVGALAASGLPPHRLELEITESVLLDDDERNVEMLHQLRALGVRIALDDFGTGYSSLSYLRKFRFDKIKMDQSFLRHFPEREDSAPILKAVAELGAGLGIATTAEGVETGYQLDRLRAMNFNEVQGYFFSRPRPAAEVESLLSDLPGKLRAAA